jgi:CHAT domain-containing protein/Tfp pilus assembly protein PilF
MTVAVLCCAASAAAGENSPDARLREARAAYQDALRLRQAGQHAEAVKQGEHALALMEPLLGDTHPEVARTLNTLAGIYSDQGLYGRAEPLLERVLAIWEAGFGRNHPNVAIVLNNLAFLYMAQGAYSRAEPLLERALAIEMGIGKDPLAAAQTLNNLANLYRMQGLYGQAEPLYQRALLIDETALGKSHPDVAKTLNNLAALYQAQGLYDRAGLLYQRAFAIWEAALGKDHPNVAVTLDNLASLYQAQGLYRRAEPLFERALSIRETALGKSHPDVAKTLNNLATLYQAQGLYGRAELLHQRALSIWEAALGKHHPDVATSLNNLAYLYQAQGRYDRAEPPFERALAIREAAFGKHHPDIALSLNNLANLYLHQGMYGRAEPLLKRALAIWEAVLGKGHPNVAVALTNLAGLYQDQKLYSQAEPLHQRALAINEAALGKSHPHVAHSLNYLAFLRLAQQRLTEAVPLFERSFAISEQRLRQEALDFSEMRMASFLQLLRAEELGLYALLREHPDNARVRRLALSAALLLKGRSAEELANISQAVYRSLGAEEHDTFERLRGVRTQLAKLSLQGPGAQPPVAYQQQLKALAEQGDALEAGLARRSAPLRELAALPSPAHIVDRVAAALPQQGALVEFITYLDIALVPEPGWRASPPPPRLRYLALVLLPNSTIRVRDLGPAEPIDVAASRLRDALANRDASFQAQAQKLYQLAFQPLLPLLGKTRRLFLSPDGQLSLVPFAALHDGHQFLVERFDFTYLTSGKDLLPRAQEAGPAGSVVVLADPDFTASPPASTLSEKRESRAWSLVPLPGTRQEAKAIERLFPQAQLYLGPEATKERLLQLRAPGILHLATHGIFLDDAPVPTPSRAVGHFGAMGEGAVSSRPPPSPLLRSGLLFSGASAQPPSSSSDTQLPPDTSLATALELASLNLWGTQLVVLSACDTGRGDVKPGQGVYGLRRAFIVAGAETVVMSLWKVNDETTQRLMEAYYTQLLAGRGRAAALRDAMQLLREAHPHPHYWAPFIALGQDAPLRALGGAELPR